MTRKNSVPGIEISGEIRPEYEAILSAEASAFLAELARRFTSQRDELMVLREERQAAIDSGVMPDFLPETAAVRD